MKLSHEMIVQAQELVARRLGLDFPEARRADLERGLLRASRTSVAGGPETYLDWLATLPDQDPEWGRLAGQLTVGETYFFRDQACFGALEQEVLPPLIRLRREEGLLRLRLWSAGCATGEEPYSLAILLDRLLPDRSEWALTILATDVNPASLEAARRGCYREWSLRDTPEWIRDRYFRKRGPETFELDPAIRQMVAFAPLNLAQDSYPSMVTNTSAMDLILSRNVLMYLTREAQQATAARLRRALVPGGWLVVAPAEASADLLRPLVPVNFPGAISYRKVPESAVRLQPSAVSLPMVSWPAETRLPDVMTPAAPIGLPTRAAAPTIPALPELPPDRATLLERARMLADQGHLEEARRLCEAALRKERLDPDAQLLLAAICQELGDLPGALVALRRALYLAPHSAPAHFLLGTLLFRRGEQKQGRRRMETVVSLLRAVPPDEALPGGDGFTAGRLLDAVRGYLAAAPPPSALSPRLETRNWRATG